MPIREIDTSICIPGTRFLGESKKMNGKGGDDRPASLTIYFVSSDSIAVYPLGVVDFG